MTNDLTFRAKGFLFTQQLEGCRLTAYQDVVGVWTTGHAHTGADVRAGLISTQPEAVDRLPADLATSVSRVNRLVVVDLDQGEFDALVDFVFDVEASAFENSMMPKLLNVGDFADAAAQFDRWNRAGGQVVADLLRRCEGEKALFEEADDFETNST
jgi:lysozyme